MYNPGNGKGTGYGREGIDGNDAGLISFIALFPAGAAIIGAVSVFGSSVWTGAIGLVVVAIITTLAIASYYRSDKSVKTGVVLLIIAAVWAGMIGFVSFWMHWLAFTPALWVLSALFVVAFLAAWRALTGFLRFLAALLAASLIAAAVVLPRPPGGEGPLDTAEEWTVDVRVTDANREPVPGASVLCGAVLSWETVLRPGSIAARETRDDGRIETWQFHEDPRLKIVICNAWKDAGEANAAYPLATKMVYSIKGGGEHKLEFTLKEDAHPDIAFLVVDRVGEHGPSRLRVDLLADGEKLQSKTGSELTGGGFTIPAALARRNLSLFFDYTGSNGGWVLAYREDGAVPVGPIPAGTRKKVTLRITGPKN